MDLKNSASPITECEICLVEEQFRFKFPQALRDLYLLHNGGQPLKSRFTGRLGPQTVHRLLPIKHGSHTVVDSLQRLKIESSLLPDGLVPFAIDRGGNFFCFSISSDQFGAVYFLDMDHLKPEDPKSAVTWLAESVKSFFDCLTDKKMASN
jgi:cell wall assembly regulator SMI1